VPAIGAALDLGKSGEPYWQKVFAGYEFSKQWLKDNTPDVIFLVYNDHATAFSLDLIPTFAIGCAAEFRAGRRGLGPAPGAGGQGPSGTRRAYRAVGDPGRLRPDHREQDAGGPRPHRAAVADVRPTRRVALPGDPFAVNVVQYPVPSGRRCFNLGRAIRKAVASFDAPLKVQVWGTGGMSHQLQGPRAGLINREWDNAFLDRLIADPATLAQMPHIDYVREAGSEGIELVMWLIARGAMTTPATGGRPRVRTASTMYPRRTPPLDT
jgi:protocatechuate 4,5-dioxygenase beta chain